MFTILHIGMIRNRFVVYHTTNQWHDYDSDEKGNIIDLAKLLMNPALDKIRKHLS